jgi:hypothetical protein
MTKKEHDRLIYLHNLMSINGVINMKEAELDEYSKLMAMSLKGKGNSVPVSQVSQGVPIDDDMVLR